METLNKLQISSEIAEEVKNNSEFIWFFAGKAYEEKLYIIPNYKEHKTVEKKIFKKEDLPEFDASLFKGITDYGYLCNLTKREEEEIKELWKEILL